MNEIKAALFSGRKMMGLCATWVVSAALGLLAGCSDQDLVDADSDARATQQICFSTATVDNAVTRSSAAEESAWNGVAINAATSDSLPIYGQILPWETQEAEAVTRGSFITGDNFASFSVSAQLVKKADQSSAYLFRDETNTRPTSDDLPWQYENNHTYYWPGDEFTVNFYAVAPVGAAVTYPQDNSRNSFSYTTPDEPANQVDLMRATVTGVEGNYNASVPLSFTHLCSAVEFVMGNTELLDGTIHEVRVVGIANASTYSFTDGWSTPTGSATYTFSPESGNEFKDDQRLILLPQELADDARIEVDYTRAGNTDSHTYTYSLKGQKWAQGERYRYSICVAPELQISFDKQTLDSHYVTTTATITVAGIRSDYAWTITASGSSKDDDGRDVSMQLESKVHSFVKEGYWTDNYRGSNTLSGMGPGTYQVRIFAPENATEEDRTFTFSLASADGKTSIATNTELKQHHPAWMGSGYGWEVEDDKESGDYGFTRSKVSVYIIPYERFAAGGLFADLVLSNLLDTYNARDYVETWQRYKPSLLEVRYYFTINYSSIPLVLEGIDSRTDGYTNTENMSKLDILSDVCPFEEAVSNTYKIESGKEDEMMFRVPNPSYNEEESVPYDKIVNETEPGILSYILKKNPYNIVTTSVQDGSSTQSLELIALKWYLPAVEQNDYPDGENLDNYWSSTSTTDDSYLLGGTAASRDTTHPVRAIRNR
jgi:hypothetical protein